MLYLFYADITLFLGNELWCYGCDTGAVVNGFFLALTAIMCAVVSIQPQGSCQPTNILRLGSVLATGYALSMMVVVLVVLRRIPPPRDGERPTFHRLRWRVMVKQVFVGIAAIALLSSMAGGLLVGTSLLLPSKCLPMQGKRCAHAS